MSFLTGETRVQDVARPPREDQNKPSTQGPSIFPISSENSNLRHRQTASFPTDDHVSSHPFLSGPLQEDLDAGQEIEDDEISMYSVRSRTRSRSRSISPLYRHKVTISPDRINKEDARPVDRTVPPVSPSSTDNHMPRLHLRLLMKLCWLPHPWIILTVLYVRSQIRV